MWAEHKLVAASSKESWDHSYWGHDLSLRSGKGIPASSVVYYTRFLTDALVMPR
jgi:hypothetical protein